MADRLLTDEILTQGCWICQHRGPQTIQYKTDSPVFKLYRVSAAPIYYLIDRDGKIAAQREGGEGILAEVVRLVDPSSDAFTRP